MSQFFLPRIDWGGILAIGRLREDVPWSAPRTASDSLERSAHICATSLAEAGRLVRMGQWGAPLDERISRACDVLDDIDDVLVTLCPQQNGAEFATAAALHRELEQIQAAIPVLGRPRGSTSKIGCAR